MAVLEQPTRFNEIKRQLEGVTQRVLTQTLRRLERNGMIQRRVLETSPSAWSTPSHHSANRSAALSHACTNGRSSTATRSCRRSTHTTRGHRDGSRPTNSSTKTGSYVVRRTSLL
ncbi:winged helix-turn-helix transcriptional regulator [Streptomyces rhizosphaericus]|uniref:winged helix-turn-helix transcriptional regulator n=1 Tax=Streptomyces rhizosphaericus TaxID=114699 RepID=UPI00363C9925